MPPRKILIVSYLFPPAGGIAVQRALSLAKYLPDHKFEVHILQARNAAVPVSDPDLLRQVPSCVLRHSAFTPEIPFILRQKLWSRFSSGGSGTKDSSTRPSPLKTVLKSAVRRLLCPEPEVLWVPFALRAARRIIRRHHIDAVLVTVPPFSALLVGNALKREFPHLKLIADFRDEWLSFYLKDFEYQNNDHTRRVAERIEQETVSRSDLVVAVAESSRRTIRSRYPDQPDSKFLLIGNGYDPDMFAGFQSRPHGGSQMLVTHMGTAYKTASPRFYLDALDIMPDQIRNAITTRFIGRISEAERAALENRRSSIEITGFMPQAEALKRVEETDYLLVTMTNEISLPGKLYEYLATRKPILAITPKNSEVSRILQETGAGWCAEPDDPIGIQSMIERAFHRFCINTNFLHTDSDKIKKYERPYLTAEYARAIHGLFDLDQHTLPSAMADTAMQHDIA